MHKWKKALTVMVLLTVLALSFSLPAFATGATPAEGDYVKFGKYQGSDIIWRIAGKDAAGNILLISDRILCFKSMDASGDGYTEYFRTKYGSNNWAETSLRAWLNSGDETVAWLNAPTVDGTAGYNPYDTEKGFLASGNFTASEVAVIADTERKVLISKTDSAEKDGGEGYHSYRYSKAEALQNAVTASYQMITDKVFLPDIADYDNIVKLETLGEAFLQAKPTAQAMNASDWAKGNQCDVVSNVRYWMGTPFCYTSYQMRCVDENGYASALRSNAQAGVRPALYLKAGVLFDAGTDGSMENPYVVGQILSGEITADGYTVKTSAGLEVGETIPATETSLKVSVTIKNESNATAKVQLMAAVYDDENRLLRVEQYQVPEIAAGAQEVLSDHVINLNLIGAAHAAVYLWDMNTLRPLENCKVMSVAATN